MTHLGPAVERGQACGCGGRGVSLNQHPVRLLGSQDRLECTHDLGRYLGGGLTWPHDVEVVVGADVEQVQDLVEHVPVLSCDADPALDVQTMAFQLPDDGGPS
jgi:hypothetical protein